MILFVPDPPLWYFSLFTQRYPVWHFLCVSKLVQFNIAVHIEAENYSSCAVIFPKFTIAPD